MNERITYGVASSRSGTSAHMDWELDSVVSEADRLMAAGDFRGARDVLEACAGHDPQEIDFWRRLATVRRACGAAAEAVLAVDRALALAPLDFISLLLRASLLELLGNASAGEAYGRALAQMPPGEPVPQMAGAIRRARTAYSAYQSDLERQLMGALPDDEANHRIRRFITNISRRTRPYHSEPTHFAYPGLRVAEFHDRSDFPWLKQWEAASEVIAAEFSAVVAAKSSELVPYIKYAAHEPVAQWSSLNNSRDWTSIHLIQRGNVCGANARHCPQTMDLIRSFPQPHIPGCGANAMFSLLAPHTVIPPHAGVANFRLICHLPLVVPPGCTFRVGAETREWRRGEAWVFDDTVEHEASNPTDEMRAIMIIDCWHPDLSAPDKEAITAVVAAVASTSWGI